MKKILFIFLLAMMLGGCATKVDYTLRDEGHIITIKIDNKYRGDDYEYRYWYKLEVESNRTSIGWYSDKNFNVGETIYIGNARGETLRDCQHDFN